MFYQLPPVGNTIQLSNTTEAVDEFQLAEQTYRPHYFASGTAALAAAITAASELKAVAKPEVILPAYGCPDLISAAVFAGARPVLVDLEAERPWLDLELLPAKINANTVAVVAVNLFGIPERLQQLRQLTEQAGTLLIEDSAQAFPGAEEQGLWQGDLIVVSFGRGKPVSLLGGGAVLCRNNDARSEELARLLPEGTPVPSTSFQKQASFWLKASLYNWMIKPWLYWLPQSLPFLHLGETRFQPLAAIEGMDEVQRSLLAANIRTYQDNPFTEQKQLAAILGECDLKSLGIIDLPSACKTAATRRLLRYPLLVEPETRERLYSQLYRLGLGPSCMYPRALPEIPGVDTVLATQGAFPQASAFAQRILTLPTHAQVKPADIEKIRQLLSC